MRFGTFNIEIEGVQPTNPSISAVVDDTFQIYDGEGQPYADKKICGLFVPSFTEVVLNPSRSDNLIAAPSSIVKGTAYSRASVYVTLVDSKGFAFLKDIPWAMMSTLYGGQAMMFKPRFVDLSQSTIKLRQTERVGENILFTFIFAEDE